MIFHILGPSGSGKTTLGEKIKQIPNTFIIDTDDIDDPNSLKVLKKYDLKTKKSEKLYDKEVAKLNQLELQKLLEQNKKKHIIVVGFLHSGMWFLKEKVDKTYAIKVKPEVLMRQYNLRTLNVIHKYFEEIKKVYEKENPQKIHYILSAKYGLRNGFDCDDLDNFKEEVNRFNQGAKNAGDLLMISDSIFKSIKKLILN